MMIARSVSTTPRLGRQLQRYDAGVRLTTGCIPLTPDGMVVLISSRSGAWILPKGGWERDETAREAAARETYEESGVYGLVHLEPLVELAYESKRGVACQLMLFLMDVKELLVEWPESSVRQRKLFSLDEAIRACGKEEHRTALRELKLRGSHQHQLHNAGSHLDFGAALNNSSRGGGTAVAGRVGEETREEER